ncbi:MAG: electron transfer flavoprotein-ubiquinone oxidoreductase [Deltaproteobacteria bacterium]|nr:electron transfer flavoprotein-ubiquinone oxidoreductase [Deltaproteobacteria bacterium]
MTETRDVMDVDVLFVGGGIASLSGALHLSNRIKEHNHKIEQGQAGKKLDEVTIAVLEKAAFPGSHGISGAVMDPSALKDLVPDFLEKGAPLEGEVKKDSIYFLTKNRKIRLPFGLIPRPFNPLDNHGNYVVSVSRLNEWLAGLVEENGVDIFPGFAGTEVLYDGNKVIGVRTGDKGIDAKGEKKGNFEPGIDLHAKVTVFGEGSRGSLTKTLIKHYNLDAQKNPPAFEVGVKEVWEIPEGRIQPGEVIHTMGYPLKSNTFGGGFIYGMKNNMISLGQLTSLDYEDPFIDPHREFQKLKLHPFVQGLLKDGKLVQYGAKTAPAGGFFSIPKLTFAGGMIIGDAANLFNAQKIKGVHIAMRSGMLAAEAILDCLVRDDFSEARLEQYRTAMRDSKEIGDLFKVRNFHQTMQKGLFKGLIAVSLQVPLGGSIFRSRLESEPDYVHMKKVAELYGTDSPDEAKKGDIKYDGKLTYDKETDVYYSGSTHEEDQPPHLKIKDLDICYNQCAKEFQNPCVRFCPADVYEMERDETTGRLTMKLNFSNCVHCKTCDVKDPYENITWVPPEGGGGPKYTVL